MKKLTYSLILVIFIATVGVGWIFDEIHEKYSDDNEIENTDVVESMLVIGSSLAFSLNSTLYKQSFINKWNKNSPYELEITSIATSSLSESFLLEIQKGKPIIIETETRLSIYYYLAKDSDLLIFKLPPTFISKKEDNINYLFTLLFYLVFLILILIWIYPLLTQLLTLRSSLKLIGEGQLEHRINSSSISYIREIENEVNDMAQRIENLVSDNKILSSAVSHNLRTPLARIRFGLDTLMEEDDASLIKRYQRKISDNVDEMSLLVETLLSYARLNQSTIELLNIDCSLLEIINRSIKINELDGVDFTLQSSENDHVINADKNYIYMMLNNLIENAVKYGSGKVIITLVSSSSTVSVVVEDNGKGIPEGVRTQVLAPFCRGEFSNSEIKGSGIGLAIVNKVVEWHKGSMKISRSKKLGGAKFSIVLNK